MALISWKTSYETTVVALDKEHRGIIEEINRLYEAIREKRTEEVLTDCLARLEEYTRNHFAHEERLMAQYNYPGLGEQQELHRELILTVQSLRARDSSEGDALAHEVYKFLRSWLLDHIVEVDKKYGSYLVARGGRFIQ